MEADRMVADFLGIPWGRLCPQFGFNHNLNHILLLEAITSFVIFQLVLLAARWLHARALRPRPAPAERPGPRDPALEELERLGTMVDRTLATMTASDNTSSMTAHQAAMRSTQERPKDLERLREEFQKKVADVKSKWQTEEAPLLIPLAGEGEEDNIYRVSVLLVVMYWGAQAVLALLVTCSVGVSMLSVGDKGVWSHYCLLTYALSNCGILPTGCQAAAFLADWLYCDAVTTLPDDAEPQPEDPSYQAVMQPVGPGGLPSASLRAAPAAEEERQRAEEVSQMRPKFVLLCLPELLPLAFMVVTHTIPFMLVFVWLTLLVAAVAYAGFLLARVLVRYMQLPARLRVLRQAQIVSFGFQLMLTAYVHVSLQVMTRVYAGEWRHGGYFDSLWLHLLTDADPLAECQLFSFARVVDFPLRWT